MLILYLSLRITHLPSNHAKYTTYPMDQHDLHKPSSSRQGQQMPLAEDDDDSLGIGEVLAVVMEYRWLISAISVLFVLLGIGWVVLAKPVYRADGLIQVEEKASGMSALKELQPLLEDNTTVAAELEILTSRMVLGRVIDRLKLNIDVSPQYFPLVGAAFARKYSGEGLSAPLLGLASYAWGGESLLIDGLDVPAGALDMPLTLIAGDQNKFELFDQNGALLLKGRAGERATSQYYSIFVSKVAARQGTRFEIVKNSLETTISNIRRQFSVLERGKKSGILEVGFTGADKEKNAIVLDDILRTYVRQNVERRSAEAENTLKFLETQLPDLKKELDSAENAYNEYRQKRGSLDLTIETESVLQSLVEVDNQIVALKQERDELRQSFTAEHPRIQAADKRLERLRERRKQFDGDIARLPDTQQEVLRLARDVEVSTTLYTNLVNTAQQLRVSKAGTVGDVRIIDPALVSNRPVGLKAPVILFISLFLGFIASASIIWILRSIRVVVEDPEVIESKLGLPVYATVPHSSQEVAIIRRARSSNIVGGELLAVTNPEDDAIESLRGLRTTIHFALMDAAHNSILITGSSPGLGKSFISKNLGAVIAQAGKRVVLVDADLRKGHINKEFGISREVGVSEYVGGMASLEDVLKPTQVPNLWVVTTGQIPPNPSELLMHSRFEELLDSLGSQFDTVIVDAPPILAVSDAAIVGRSVGATLMVARAGRTPIRELEQAVRRLNQAGVHVKGFVFNDLNTASQKYRYGYKGYVYRYTYSKTSRGGE